MEAAGGGSQPSSIFSLLLALQLSLKELGVWVVFVFCFFLKKKKSVYEENPGNTKTV